jgi:hypothetical protein
MIKIMTLAVIICINISCAIKVGEKNIGTPKMRINLVLSQAIGFFSIDPYKIMIIAFNLLCFIFGISSLLLFLTALSMYL